ncbi:MAG: hypothetical protein ACK55Z_09485, partial [bacterium]
MQGLRRRLHLRARLSEEQVQGMRRRLLLRARPREVHVQGMRRQYINRRIEGNRKLLPIVAVEH